MTLPSLSLAYGPIEHFAPISDATICENGSTFVSSPILVSQSMVLAPISTLFPSSTYPSKITFTSMTQSAPVLTSPRTSTLLLSKSVTPFVNKSSDFIILKVFSSSSCSERLFAPVVSSFDELNVLILNPFL